LKTSIEDEKKLAGIPPFTNKKQKSQNVDFAAIRFVRLVAPGTPPRVLLAFGGSNFLGKLSEKKLMTCQDLRVQNLNMEEEPNGLTKVDASEIRQTC